MILAALEACPPLSQAILGPLHHRTIYHHHLPRLRQRPPLAHTITIRPNHLRSHILITTPLPAVRIRARITLKRQPPLVTLELCLRHRARSTLKLDLRGTPVPFLLLRPTLTEATVLHQVFRHILHLHRVSNPGCHPNLRLIPAMDSPHRLGHIASTRRTVLHLHLLPRLDKALEATEAINRGLTERCATK
jgi:hypothetical protein